MFLKKVPICSLRLHFDQNTVFYLNIYRALAWKSRWRCPIGLTQSDLMTSLSYGTADRFSPVSVANELTAQYSNTWLLFAVAVSSALQKPSTFPSSTCIDLLRGDSCMLWGVIRMCFMCSSSISYMLTAACYGCIVSSESRYLLCRSSSSSIADLFLQDQIHYYCHVHYHANPSESCHDRT